MPGHCEVSRALDYDISVVGDERAILFESGLVEGEDTLFDLHVRALGLHGDYVEIYVRSCDVEVIELERRGLGLVDD